jgi:hypothetical protein
MWPTGVLMSLDGGQRPAQVGFTQQNQTIERLTDFPNMAFRLQMADESTEMGLGRQVPQYLGLLALSNASDGGSVRSNFSPGVAVFTQASSAMTATVAAWAMHKSRAAGFSSCQSQPEREFAMRDASGLPLSGA